MSINPRAQDSVQVNARISVSLSSTTSSKSRNVDICPKIELTSNNLLGFRGKVWNNQLVARKKRDSGYRKRIDHE